MRTTEENVTLSQLLFPDVKETPEDVEKRYPKRNLEKEAMVLRFAPSPTGFLHIGGVFMSLVDRFLTNQSKGVFILRIEDTDKEREVEGGISEIVSGLSGFGIEFDEGMVGSEDSKGEYGPYSQSKRLDIYRIFAKNLVSIGAAYPCFMTEEELSNIRTQQEKDGLRTGCYGKWAKYRDESLENLKKKLDAGEKFVIRLYSTGNAENSFIMNDLIKGSCTLRENDMDAVLLKSDGYPTYHFAHPIDDVLMGITLVTRADEWFASVSLHYELFSKLGFDQIPYAHFSPLMKLDNDGNSKRKLSKRKDPESDVQYYIKRGYPSEGVKEYLLTVANSNFYDWRIQNPGAPLEEFVLKLEKFHKSGALFDIVKLDDMCKNYISTLTANEVYDRVLNWAEKYSQETFKILKENEEYCIRILNIERVGPKIRKDIVKFEDIKNQLEIFFDDMFDILVSEDISERVSKDIQINILEKYLEVFNIPESTEVWFEVIKNLANEMGIGAGEFAMVLRVAITKRTKSPDLYQIIQVLGEQRVKERLEKYMG